MKYVIPPPNTSFQRALTRGGLLAPSRLRLRASPWQVGRRDSPPPASGRWADLHPPYLSSPRPEVAAGGEFAPLNSDR
jgi:hypothetical protein